MDLELFWHPLRYTMYRVAQQWCPGENFNIVLVTMAGFTIYLALFTGNPPRGGLRTISTRTSLVSHTVSMNLRWCQIDMQGPHLCTKPCHFGNLYVATSKKIFSDLKLFTCSTICHFKFTKILAFCITKLHLLRVRICFQSSKEWRFRKYLVKIVGG